MGRFGDAGDWTARAAAAKAAGDEELVAAMDAAAPVLAEAEDECRYLRQVASDLVAAWDPAWEGTWDGYRHDGNAALVVGEGRGIRAGFQPFSDGSGRWKAVHGLEFAVVPAEGCGYFVETYEQQLSVAKAFPLSGSGFLDTLWGNTFFSYAARSNAELFGQLSRLELSIDRGELEERLAEHLVHAAELAGRAG